MMRLSNKNKQYRRARKRSLLKADINVTPFIDVMLVLLIVFMISAPMLVMGVDINLPEEEAQPVKTDASKPISVSIKADKTIHILNQEVALEDLAIKIKAIMANKQDDVIYLRADKTLDYGWVMKIMTRLQSAGITNIAFVTESEAK